MPDPLNVLVIGSGGREHALVKACLASPLVGPVTAAPGNGGIALEAACAPLDVGDVGAAVDLARALGSDFVIVGPEAPLCAGVVDALEAAGIPAFGPRREAARLEGSKAYTKDFLRRHQVPTAGYGTFTDAGEAAAFIQSRGGPVVVKASGLAAGKGVVMAETPEEAVAAARDMLEGGRFGEAGSEVVVEDRLEGEEASIHVIVSGTRYVALPPSQDHKRAGENDTGPNTGGMGAYAPAAVVDPALRERVAREIIEPTLAGLDADGIDYRGTLYIGIMITAEGPKVLEFNVRFGDPETQVLLPLLETDPVKLMYDCALGRLEPGAVKVRPEYAVVVVMAAEGYPGDYRKGDPIKLPPSVPERAAIIHAGTCADGGGQIVTNGGRVLGVTGRGDTLEAATGLAYAVCQHIRWNGATYRRDIAARELNR